MPKYYCNKCAGNYLESNFVGANTNFTGSNYQNNKWYKHMEGSGSYPLNSVFKKEDFEGNSEYDTYKNYMIEGKYSGSLEIDDKGRENIIYFAGKDIGLTLDSNDNIISNQNEFLKIVCWKDVNHIHSFTTSSNDLHVHTCELCGEPIIRD